MVSLWIFLSFNIFFLLSYVIQVTNFLIVTDYINFIDTLVLVWICVIVSSVYFLTTSTWGTTTILYFFGMYRSLVTNFSSSCILIFKNVILSLNFVLYNLIDFFTFLPKLQIWMPLYRKGGYLLLLNSSKSRWQLTKTNNIFLNK